MDAISLLFLVLIATVDLGVPTAISYCEKFLFNTAPRADLGKCVYPDDIISWVVFRLFGPRDHGRPLVTCRRGTASESASCKPQVPEYVVKVQSGLREFIYGYTWKLTRREHSGHWLCSLLTEPGAEPRNVTCETIVYEPPRSVDCQIKSFATFVTATCLIDCIFPAANCVWTYALDNRTAFKPVPDSELHFQNHQAFIIYGHVYYHSTCSVHLSWRGGKPDNPLRPGRQVTVQSHVRPRVPSDDYASHNVTWTVTGVARMMELPGPPTFWLFDEPVKGNSVYVIEGSVTQVACRLETGTPVVYSVGFACDFPVGDETDDVLAFGVGTAYVMRKRVEREVMHRKNCSCWGIHVTGLLDKTPMRLYTVEPATVSKFIVTGTTETGVSLHRAVSMECQTAGFPQPLSAILKVGHNEAPKKLVWTTRSFYPVKWRLRMQCTDIGVYVCQAENKAGGKVYKASRYFTLRAQCSPTRCAEEKSSWHIVIAPNKTANIPVCVVAFPAPKTSTFGLTKGDKLMFPDGNRTTITLTTYDNVLMAIKVTFRHVTPDEAGHYKLVYKEGGGDKADSFVVLGDIKLDVMNSTHKKKDEKDEKKDNSSSDMLKSGLLFSGIALLIFCLALIYSIRMCCRKAAKDQHPGMLMMGGQ